MAKTKSAVPKALQRFLASHKGAITVAGSGGGGTSWRPRPGDTLEGRILKYKTRQGDNKQDVVEVNTKTGVISVWLTKVLKRQISSKDVGKNVFIGYSHDVPPKKRGWHPTKIFVVAMSNGKGK